MVTGQSQYYMHAYRLLGKPTHKGKRAKIRLRPISVLGIGIGPIPVVSVGIGIADTAADTRTDTSMIVNAVC